jgi:hypothetical protein
MLLGTHIIKYVVLFCNKKKFHQQNRKGNFYTSLLFLTYYKQQNNRFIFISATTLTKKKVFKQQNNTKKYSLTGVEKVFSFLKYHAKLTGISYIIFVLLESQANIVILRSVTIPSIRAIIILCRYKFFSLNNSSKIHFYDIVIPFISITFPKFFFNIFLSTQVPATLHINYQLLRRFYYFLRQSVLLKKQ